MTEREPVQIVRLSPRPTSNPSSPPPPSPPPPTERHSIVNVGHPSYSATSRNNPGTTYKIRTRCLDPLTKQYFVLWSDVQTVIKDACYAVDSQDGTLVPFMVGENYIELVPRKILSHPDRILDVVTSTNQSQVGWMTPVWLELRNGIIFSLTMVTITLPVVLMIKLFSWIANSD
ncbi:hypothetical protein EMPS_08506 [Entomortierella parvispora]|uniref:Uncharacterized protein n=1 Tax=Entomortierella parvispora TaxID=205924 RepID=A0A9P3LZI0_9FUNG|nr:hypothetical protein EMPS_08506 [Entomortierella parvispora]